MRAQSDPDTERSTPFDRSCVQPFSWRNRRTFAATVSFRSAMAHWALPAADKSVRPGPGAGRVPGRLSLRSFLPPSASTKASTARCWLYCCPVRTTPPMARAIPTIIRTGVKSMRPNIKQTNSAGPTTAHACPANMSLRLRSIASRSSSIRISSRSICSTGANPILRREVPCDATPKLPGVIPFAGLPDEPALPACRTEARRKPCGATIRRRSRSDR